MSTMTRPMVLGQTDEARPETASTVLSEEEFRLFYDRTSRPLWVYLTRVTGDRNLADDLLQEAYYRFYRAGAVHESDLHRRNSLFRIATNLARDDHRRFGHIHRSELDEEREYVSGNRSTPAVAFEVRNDLQRALSQLEPRQRELLWLAYAHGSSHEEIADTVGLTRGSVKSLLLRARRKLAAILRRDEIGPGGAS